MLNLFQHPVRASNTDPETCEEYQITSSDYQKLTYSDLEHFVENIQQRPFIKADDKLRLSLAGAQGKLSMKIGSNYEIGKITQDDFKLLASSVGVNVKVVTSILEELKCVIEENPVVV